MSELASAMFSIADATSFGSRSFILSMKRLPLGTLRKFAQLFCSLSDTSLWIVKNVAKTQNEMKNTAEKNFTYFAPTNVSRPGSPELEPSRLLTVAAYHNAIVPCESHIF